MKKYIFAAGILCLYSFVYGGWDGPTKKTFNPELKYFMHTGFTLDATVKTAIFSFNAFTPVIAQTESDITFLGKVVIPKNTKLIGYSQIEKSLDRVNVLFNTIVFPDGQEMKFSGIALHTDGSAGIPGKKTDLKKAVLPAKILLSAAAAGAAASSNSSVAAEMIKGVSDEATSQLASQQDSYIEVPKDRAIFVYIVERLEY